MDLPPLMDNPKAVAHRRLDNASRCPQLHRHPSHRERLHRGEKTRGSQPRFIHASRSPVNARRTHLLSCGYVGHQKIVNCSLRPSTGFREPILRSLLLPGFPFLQKRYRKRQKATKHFAVRWIIPIEGILHPISVNLVRDVSVFSSVVLSDEVYFGCGFSTFFPFFQKSDDARRLARARVVVFKILRVLRVLGGQNTFKINILYGQRSPFTG